MAQLCQCIDEKSHVIDITEKGRNVLAPDKPDTFIIPDLGELILEIDDNTDLDDSQRELEKDKAHQFHAERSGTIHNFNQLLRAYTMYEKDVDYVIHAAALKQVDTAEYNPFECIKTCLLYTSPSPRDRTRSRMPSSA